jgi:hypothetical protein
MDYPGNQAFLVIPCDSGIHFGIMHETVVSMGHVLRDLPSDFGVGDVDCAVYRIRKSAPRNAVVSNELQTQDYRGLLQKGGLNLGS